MKKFFLMGLAACAMLFTLAACSDDKQVADAAWFGGTSSKIDGDRVELSCTFNVAESVLKESRVGFAYVALGEMPQTRTADYGEFVETTDCKISGKTVTAVLRDLKGSSLYGYYAFLDLGNTRMRSELATFTTPEKETEPEPEPEPGKPVIGSLSATDVTTESALLKAEFKYDGQEKAAFKFLYKKSGESAYSDVVATASAESGDRTVSAKVSGLTADSEYEFKLQAVVGSEKLESRPATFKTQKENTPEVVKPVFGIPASESVESASAVVKCEFEYTGTESVALKFRYRKSGESSWQEMPVSYQGGKQLLSAKLVNLQPESRYEFQLQAVVGQNTYESASSAFTTEKEAVTPPTPSTPTGLMEMPEMQQKPGDYYYATYMCDGRIEGKNMRNYSACYSKNHRSTVWVAAPMHRCYMAGHYHRTDRWGYAPGKYGIPEDIQPNLKKSYKGNYSRGHMVASSDRHPEGADCDRINAQTFYYTNMCPQIQNGFNGGIWNHLEQAVQDWGMQCRDTLYVVSGAVYNGRLTCSDNSGKKVDVPSHFYKVVIRSKSGNSGKGLWELPADQLECAGWYFEHKAYSGSYSAVITTVEDVEKKSGMKFFVNIPNAPKSRLNKSFWN